MSQKQNKSRLFVIILVIMVVIIIAVGLFLTSLIIKDGEKSKTTSFIDIDPKQAYVLMDEKNRL